MRICILGSGSWGSALSVHFGRLGFSVIQWFRENALAELVNSKRENPTYLPSVLYPDTVKTTSDIYKALESSELVISAIPAQFSRGIWKTVSDELKGKLLICASKGIEVSSLKLLSQVYQEVVSGEFAVLSGPTFAKEVATLKPTAAVIASEKLNRALEIAQILNSQTLRLYASSDVVGVEVGGALKNVIAIAAGISDGMELGLNARAALITRGLHEIRRLGKKLGAKDETFYGLSGMGDLILTCTGELSRNRNFGLKLGRGQKADEGKFVVEGIHTVKAAKALSERLKIPMPISEAVFKIIYENYPISRAMRELMSRPVKEERL